MAASVNYSWLLPLLIVGASAIPLQQTHYAEPIPGAPEAGTKPPSNGTDQMVMSTPKPTTPRPAPLSPNQILTQTVQTNFLQTLFLMANASAFTGARVSVAAGTIIRGFVQDSFNLASLGAYLPRLIFLDGPSQFIEVLRLVRTNQLRIPQDVDEAMDTLINFATYARDSQAFAHTITGPLSFFPNVFRGAELLSTEVLYGVFSWLAPIAPQEISSAAVEALWNRWDIKSSTTSKYT